MLRWRHSASRGLAVAVAAAAIPLLALWTSVGGRAPTQKEVVWSDLPWYFVPTFAVLHRALDEGFFPLWNPWQLAGWPFLAAFQTQVLYPPAWLVAWLPPPLAVTAYNAAHWAWAFAGMALLARGLGMGMAAACSAAALYALAGPVAGTFYMHSASLAVLGWVPWIALAVVRVGTDGAGARRVALLALALALGLLAGAPEHFFYGSVAVAMVAAWTCAGAPASGRVRTVVALAGGAALAALLCAAQLLPTLELMERAVRSADTFPAEYITRFRVDTGKLLRAVAGAGGGVGRVSVLFVPLAVLALCSRATRAPAAWFLACGLLVLDYLRGMDGFAFPLVYDWVPPVRGFRTQLRAEPAWSFCAALVAGYGVEALGRLLAARPRAAAFAGIAVLAAVTADAGHRAMRDKVFLPLQAPELFKGTADLAVALSETPKRDRVFLDHGIPGAGLLYKFGSLRGVRHVSEYDALVPSRYAELFRMPPEKPWMGALRFRDHEKDLGYTVVQVPGVDLAALDLLATRYYLATTRRAGYRLAEYVSGVVRYRGDYTVVERSRAPARAYTVHRTVPVATTAEALDAIRDKSFDPRQSVVLTGADLAVEPAAGDEEAPIFLRDEPNVVTLRARCSSRCVLVLADLHYPGWEARVDGRPVEIATANYLLRAVPLEAGEHEVVFEYRPLSFAVGLGVSAATAAGLLLLLWRRRKPAAPEPSPSPN